MEVWVWSHSNPCGIYSG